MGVMVWRRQKPVAVCPERPVSAISNGVYK